MATARYHWANFDLIGILQHFIFGDEIVAADDQMRFDDQVQITQQFFDALGAFDFDVAFRMA